MSEQDSIRAAANCFTAARRWPGISNVMGTVPHSSRRIWRFNVDVFMPSSYSRFRVLSTQRHDFFLPLWKTHKNRCTVVGNERKVFDMPKISKAERKIIDRESPYLDRMYSVIPIPSQQKQNVNGQCCKAWIQAAQDADVYISRSGLWMIGMGLPPVKLCPWCGKPK